MHSILNRDLFFVKEHVGMFKAANNYDILDPDTQELIMNCREEDLAGLTKVLRFTGLKTATPFNIVITTANGDKVCTVRRGWTWWMSKVEVLDENDNPIGFFQQKLGWGGKFEVQDTKGNVLCMLKGKWHAWDFTFFKDDLEFAQVSKEWAGLGKELFTTADNYMLQIYEAVKYDNPIRIMIVAAVMCIDMVMREAG